MHKLNPDHARAATALLKKTTHERMSNFNAIFIDDKNPIAYVTDGRALFAFPVPADLQAGPYLITKSNRDYFLQPHPTPSELTAPPFNKVIPDKKYAMSFEAYTMNGPHTLIDSPKNDTTLLSALHYAIGRFIGNPINYDYLKTACTTFKGAFTITKQVCETTKPITITDTQTSAFFVIMPILTNAPETKEL